MYTVYLNYDPNIMKCYNTVDGNNVSIDNNSNININSIKDISCKHKDGLNLIGFTSKDDPINPVTKLYNGMTLYPLYDNDNKLIINLSFGSNNHTVYIDQYQTLRNAVTPLIDARSFNINTTQFVNTSTYETISIDDPIKHSGMFNVKLDPLITFNYGSSSTTIPASSAIPPRINIEEGYTFNGWKSQYGMWDSIDLSKINEPLTFTAIISKQNYKVNFEGCGNTIINVPHGTIISKANNTTFNNINCDKEGHIFNGWKEEFTNNIKSLNILCIILYVVICYIIFYFIKVLYTQLQIRVGKSGYANA